jgi:hypothetical protein
MHQQYTSPARHCIRDVACTHQQLHTITLASFASQQGQRIKIVCRIPKQPTGRALVYFDSSELAVQLLDWMQRSDSGTLELSGAHVYVSGPPKYLKDDRT